MQLSPSLTQTLTNLNLPPYPTVTGLPQPITVQSLASFVGALVWAWLLLVSFTGWGRLTGKLLRVQSLPASVACSLGIATFVFLGGWLNLASAIYPSILFALTVLGVAFYVGLLKQRPEEYKWLRFWRSAPRWSRLLIIVTILILILRVAATVRLGEFSVYDDGVAYLVFPQKMLAAHHFASDPFSDRRVISSLGGSYILQALILAATSLAHIGMADRTLGLALMSVALFDLGITFGLTAPQIAMMEFIAYLVPQPTFNLTSEILPISLFVSMVWIIFRTTEAPENHRLRYAAMTGAVGGAILALKSTFLPFVGALALIPYIFLFWKKKHSHTLTLPVVAGIGCLVVVAAWMIAMKQNSGTFLFPLLGHGFDYSSYGVFSGMQRFSGSNSLRKVFVQGVVLLALLGVQGLAGVRGKRQQLSFGILLAAAFAVTALNYESGGDYIWRYNFPQFFTAIVVFFVTQAGVYNRSAHVATTKIAYGLATLCLIGCIFYYDLEGGRFEPFQQMRIEMGLYPGNLRVGLSGRHLVNPGTTAEYAAVEAALPAGTTALDTSADSFLFVDRDHKQFLLNDWPGAASPPPGWPLTQGPEAVAQFLSRSSIRYVVYDYEFGGWRSMRACQFFPRVAHFSELDEALQLLTLVTLHQFDQLRSMHKTIYDDGKIAVIDLDSPVSPLFSVEQDWTLHTSKEEMCSQVVQRYVAAHPQVMKSPTS